MRRLVGGLTLALFGLVLLLAQMAILGWTDETGSSPRLDHAFPAAGPALWVANALVLALPATIAATATLGSFLAADQQWQVVRTASETLRREIYRYKAAVRTSDSDLARRRLEAVLLAVDRECLRVGAALALVRSSVTRARPQDLEDDDALEPLTARSYLKHRVEAQLAYFRSTTKRQHRTELLFIITGTAAAATATLLAGTRFALWITFLVLIASGVTVARQRARRREQAAGFGRAVADVDAVRLGWLGRPVAERLTAEGLRDLVEQVEAALEREQLTWNETVRRAAQDAADYKHPVLDG